MSEDHLTRNLTVLFGFFFVILSTLIAATSTVNGFLGIPSESNPVAPLRVVLYFIAVLLGVGCTLVGIEVWFRFVRDGLESPGSWGLSCLIIIVPFGYNVLLAMLLYIDSYLFAIGVGVFLFLVQMPYTYSFFKKEFDDA